MTELGLRTFYQRPSSNFLPKVIFKCILKKIFLIGAAVAGK